MISITQEEWDRAQVYANRIHALAKMLGCALDMIEAETAHMQRRLDAHTRRDNIAAALTTDIA